MSLNVAVNDLPDNLLDSLTDEQLMLSYAAGDTAAFTALYARHESTLFRFVRRVLGHVLAAQAEEVFQDTWLKIVMARASFVPQASGTSGASWKTWAFTVAYNTCLDRLRKSGREVALPAQDEGDESALDWLQAELGHSHPSSEDTAFWRAAGQQLMHCLDTLPPAQRAAFLLHHEDGCSLQELAQRLQIAAEAAKSRLRYALNKLRGCMGSYLTGISGVRA